MTDWHPNTKHFIEIMNTIDLDLLHQYHGNKDFGQVVRNLSEKQGNIELDYPSDEAIQIAIHLAKAFRRKIK